MITMKRTLCVRCGVPGERRRRTPLCGDCKDVMTEEEQAIWGVVKSDVESSHRKDDAA